MIQKKICLIGQFAVGKTSLVARFVKSIFSDRYQTTVGVKIEKKVLTVAGQEVTLVIWDLAGEDEFQKVRLSNLRGASGYLFVADGTRRATLDTARTLEKRVREVAGFAPAVLVLNKADLTDDWEVDEQAIAEAVSEGWTVLKASARTGEGVEEAFRLLTEKMLSSQNSPSQH